MASAIGGKGLEGGKFRDLDRDHPDLDKYKRMQKAGLPQGAIENALMRDGILPSSMFDAPINSIGAVHIPLVINKMDIPPPPPLPPPGGSAPPPAPGGGDKPPPGLSLMEEMKWRQANAKKKTPFDESSIVGGGGLKIPERKKSIAQPQRMVALKPRAGGVALEPVSEPAKISPALAPALKPTPKPILPGGTAAAKYTAPVYSSVLKPTPKPGDRKPSVVVPSFVKPSKPAANEPERPKVEIEFMPAPTEQLLPQRKPYETVTLEDGTKVTRDKDGGFTQVNPNGVIIQQFADGATKQTSPDGTIIEVSGDGLKTTQINPDGVRFESFQGEVTTCFSDGTIVRDLANGEKHQTNPDGTIIHTYNDGRKVQTSIHDKVEITSHPDGSVDQVDHATGRKLHMKADGAVEQLAS